MLWKMTLFCKIFRALNHLTFSMHFNFWEMQVLSRYQGDTHLSVTNFKSNPPLARRMFDPWDEGSSSALICNNFTCQAKISQRIKVSISQFSIFFLVFKCIQWFTNAQIFSKESQMTQIFISWYSIFTHGQLYEQKLATLCIQKRQDDNFWSYKWQDGHLAQRLSQYKFDIPERIAHTFFVSRSTYLRWV